MSRSMRLTLVPVLGVAILVVGAVVARAVSAPAEPAEVLVSLGSPTEFSIDSSVTEFEPGGRYRFVVTNNGSLAHEFMLVPLGDGTGEHSGSGGHDVPDSGHDKALLVVLPSDLAPGATKTVDLVFPKGAANGEIEMACRLAGHYEAGMMLAATVRQS